MVRYSGSIVVPYDRKRVWAVMSNWTNLVKWDINITRSDRVAGQPTPDRVGTRFDCTFEANGLKSDVDYTCVKYDEEKMDLAQFVGIAPLAGPLSFRSQDTLTFKDASEDGKTELTAEFDLKFRGLFSPLSFLMNKTMQETGPKVMKDIEKFLDEQLA